MDESRGGDNLAVGRAGGRVHGNPPVEKSPFPLKSLAKVTERNS